MESLYYLRAQILAASLTDKFNKFHYSYSAACWEAHEIFRKKRLLIYDIYPEVEIAANNNIVVTVNWR